MFELEKDILEKTIDIIKKDPGTIPENLTNKEKTIVINFSLIFVIKLYQIASAMASQVACFIYSFVKLNFCRFLQKNSSRF